MAEQASDAANEAPLEEAEGPAGEAVSDDALIPAAARPTPNLHTLCIDIGGSGIKAIVLDEQGAPISERVRIATPRPATPEAVIEVIKEILAQVPAFDRISAGYPGVVKEGVIFSAANLDGEWIGFPLRQQIEALTGKPARVINDAGVQGYGAISGKGSEIILTLGTGMGFAMFINGTYVPNIELAHHPLRKGYTYEDYIGNAELKRIGKRRWNKRVKRVLDQIFPIFNPDRIYLGGGNARLLKFELPESVARVENIAGLLGGIALWRYQQ